MTNYGSGVVSVYFQDNTLGNGGNGFTWNADYTATKPSFPILRDFSGDGIADIAVIEWGGSSSDLAFYQNNGDGTFAAPHRLASGDAQSVTVGNFDGNGTPDIAFAAAPTTFSSQMYLTVLYDVGIGTYQAAYSSPPLAAGAVTGYMVAGDFDGDRLDDLAAGSGSAYGVLSPTLAIYHNAGGHQWDAPSFYGDASLPTQRIATGDLNSDGKLDVALVTSSGSLLTVLNQGGGVFDVAHAPQYGGWYTWNLLATGHFHTASQLDILSLEGGGTYFVDNRGDGTFNDFQSYYLSLDGGMRMAVLGINGDHHPDVAVSHQTDQDVAVLTNHAGKAFSTESTFPVGASPVQIAAADLNHDGFDDVVTENAEGTVAVLLSDGTKLGGATPYPFTSGGTLKLVDFDGDGNVDILLGLQGVDVLLNNGDGTFAAVTHYDGLRGGNIAVADLNGDGKLDVVGVTQAGSCSKFANAISVWLQGTSSDAQYNITLPWCLQYVAVADIDHDGKPDVVGVDHVNGDLWFFLNRGDGTLTPASTNPNPFAPSNTALLTADFDADGYADIAGVQLDSASAGTDAEIGVMSGFTYFTGHGTFAQTFGAGRTVADAAAADFDGDGLPDLLTLSGRNVFVLLNASR